MWCQVLQPSGVYICSPFAQNPTTSPEKFCSTWVILFPAWFHSPKREAINSWWAVLPCHIMTSYLSYLTLFSYNKAPSSNPFSQWDFVLKSLSPQSALWRGGDRRGPSHLIACAKAGEALRSPRIMQHWFNTSPCHLKTDSNKMSMSIALKIQVPMGWQP